MIVVVQCAGSKPHGAGKFKSADGRPVKFVAQPELAPNDDFVYVRPDDQSDQGLSWRELLLQYNKQSGANNLALLRACELYAPPVYQALANQLGIERLYILSAGWGLISAGFLTPDYDITFSTQARGPDAYKRRRKDDVYDDFCMLPQDTREPVLFFGGKDYLPLFQKLTSSIESPRVVFHRSTEVPNIPGCIPVRFNTKRSTNWHYECADAYLAGCLDFSTA